MTAQRQSASTVTHLEAALALVEKGIPVLPVHAMRHGRCSCGDSKCGRKNAAKHPIGQLVPHGLKDATTDAATVRRWWRAYPDANIAIPTGPASGRWVLDVDSHEDPGKDGRNSLRGLEAEFGPLPETIRNVTGGSGQHIHFRYPDGAKVPNSASALAPGLDGRGDGGYVLMVPSETTGLYLYTARFSPSDVALADAPAWLLERVREKPRTPRPEPKARQPIAGAHPYAIAALEAELALVAGAAQGGRNDQLNRSTFNIGQLLESGRLSEREVAERFEDAAARSGLVEDDGLASVQRTIRSGLEDGRAQPREIPPGRVIETKPASSHRVDLATGEVLEEHQVDVDNHSRNGFHARPVVPYQDDLPPIVVTNRPLRDVSRDALESLRAANDPPGVFVRSAELVCVQVDEKERPVIRPLVEAALRGRLERSANFLTVRVLKNGTEQASHTPPPIDVVRDVMHLNDEWALPPLEGIVEVPVLRQDGSILDSAGYDSSSRLVYRPVSGLRVPPIPRSPTDVDVARALEVIDEAIGDFPFATPAAYANTLGLMLTPIIRQMTDEPVPMALIDAPMAGTGKGLLGEAVALIATGRPAGTTPEASDDDEWRKRITSLMRDGTTVVTIDNVQRRLEAPSLASVLTARVWRERVLGQTGTQEWPQRATWIATGNNIQLGGDLARRCYWIRLDSGLEEPWRRPTEGFRHHPLLPWVAERRGELLAALLVLARAWYAAGRPQPGVRPTLGSFETWSAIVSGILAHAGVPDFLGNLDDLYSRNNDERSEWQGFLLVWHERYGAEPTLLAKVASDLLGDMPLCRGLRDALPGPLADAASSGQGSFTRRLGRLSP